MVFPANTLSVYDAGNDFKTTDGTANLPIRLAAEGKEPAEHSTTMYITALYY